MWAYSSYSHKFETVKKAAEKNPRRTVIVMILAVFQNQHFPTQIVQNALIIPSKPIHACQEILFSVFQTLRLGCCFTVYDRVKRVRIIFLPT